MALIAASDLISVTPPNNPPEWTSTPAPVFPPGVGGTYSLSQNAFDPESDPITYTLNGGSAALPTGVTISGTDLVGSDQVGEGTTTGIIIDADDGVNSLVASPSFNIVGSVQDLIWMWDYTHTDIVVDQSHPDVTNWVAPSQSNVTPDAGNYFEVRDDLPLTTVNPRYFRTKITRNGFVNWRAEVSEQSGGNTLRRINYANSHSGPHYSHTKLWYGFLIRIDGYLNESAGGDSLVNRRGHLVQFHNEKSGFGSPRVSLQFKDFGKGDPLLDGIGVQMGSNVDNGGSTYYFDPVVDEPDIIGPVRAFIFEVIWDTRSELLHGTNCDGILRLYIDDNPTAALEWGNESQGKNNAAEPGSDGGKLPYLKFGLYKSRWKSSSSADDGDYHEQSHGKVVVHGANANRAGVLASLNWADRTGI